MSILSAARTKVEYLEDYYHQREALKTYKESSEAANRIIEQQIKDIALLQAELAKKDAEIADLKKHRDFWQTIAMKYAPDDEVFDAE